MRQILGVGPRDNRASLGRLVPLRGGRPLQRLPLRSGKVQEQASRSERAATNIMAALLRDALGVLVYRHRTKQVS